MKKVISMLAIAALVSAISLSNVYADDAKCEKKESSCCAKKKEGCCKKGDAKTETAQPEKK